MEANDTEKHFSARLFTNACNSRNVHICIFKYKSLVDIKAKIYKKYEKNITEMLIIRQKYEWLQPLV
jgi:hypothetical protein